MKQLRLNHKELSDAGVLSQAKNHRAAMTEHAELFPALSPPDDEFDALVTAMQEALARQATALSVARQCTKEKKAARAALETALTRRARGVEDVAQSAPGALNLGGFHARSERTPSRRPEAPVIRKAEHGSVEHTLRIGWKRVRGARTYVVEMCVGELSDTGWHHAGVSTKTRFVAEGLTAGVVYWFRVAAVGAAGRGPWSSELSRMAV